MLIRLESFNLQRLLQRYYFDRLLPSPAVHAPLLPEQEIFFQGEDRRRRRIFYKVEYDAREKSAVEEVKRLMKVREINEDINDELILKHIYAAKWDLNKTVQRLKEVISYNSNQRVTRLDEETIKRLQMGCAYTYGYDKKFLPMLIIRIDKINFNLPMEEIFNTIYYLMLIVKAYRMVPHQAEKMVIIIDFNDISFTALPYFHLYDILRSMSVFYCGLTEKVYLYNSEGIGKIWKLVYSFLPEYQKKRIVFIHKGEEKKVLEWVNQMQLQRKYGGKLANLDIFWPPREATEDLPLSDSEQYFSVENNLQFFDPTFNQYPSLCQKQCSCNIY